MSYILIEIYMKNIILFHSWVYYWIRYFLYFCTYIFSLIACESNTIVTLEYTIQAQDMEYKIQSFHYIYRFYSIMIAMTME